MNETEREKYKSISENKSDHNGLVRGYTWKGRMSNGAVFEFWTPRRITRTQARREIFHIANVEDYYQVYDPDDLESLWKCKG